MSVAEDNDTLDGLVPPGGGYGTRASVRPAPAPRESTDPPSAGLGNGSVVDTLTHAVSDAAGYALRTFCSPSG